MYTTEVPSSMEPSGRRITLFISVLATAFSLLLLSTNILQSQRRRKYGVSSPGIPCLIVRIFTYLTAFIGRWLTFAVTFDPESRSDVRDGAFVLAGYGTILVFGVAIVVDESAKQEAARQEAAARHLQEVDAPKLSPFSGAAILRWIALILTASVLTPLLLEGGLGEKREGSYSESLIYVVLIS